MNEITEFLRARYAEARKAEMGKLAVRLDAPWDYTMVHDWDNTYVLIGKGESPFRPRMSIEEFNERHTDPAPDPFVLADLDAKLALIDEHPATRDVIAEKPDGLHGFGCATCHQDEGRIVGYGWCRTLRFLAVPYADHPGYRQEWRP